jgi:hypothetical protein
MKTNGGSQTFHKRLVFCVDDFVICVRFELNYNLIQGMIIK